MILQQGMTVNGHRLGVPPTSPTLLGPGPAAGPAPRRPTCPAQTWPLAAGTALLCPRWSPRRHPSHLLPLLRMATTLRATCPKQRWPPQSGCSLPLPKMAARSGSRRAGRGLRPGSRARGRGGGAPAAEPEVPRCLLQLVVISCGSSVLRRRGSAAAGWEDLHL